MSQPSCNIDHATINRAQFAPTHPYWQGEHPIFCNDINDPHGITRVDNQIHNNRARGFRTPYPLNFEVRLIPSVQYRANGIACRSPIVWCIELSCLANNTLRSHVGQKMTWSNVTSMISCGGMPSRLVKNYTWDVMVISLMLSSSTWWNGSVWLGWEEPEGGPIYTSTTPWFCLG